MISIGWCEVSNIVKNIFSLLISVGCRDSVDFIEEKKKSNDFGVLRSFGISKCSQNRPSYKFYLYENN